MSVIVSFQCPDWDSGRNPVITNESFDPEMDIKVEGFDLDFSYLTVYPRDKDMDENLVLAVKAPYMNEDGAECGMIGWRIEPDDELLKAQPELRQHVGKCFGRVIVTAGG